MNIDLEDLFEGLSGEDLINIIEAAFNKIDRWPPDEESLIARIRELSFGMLNIANDFYKE